MAAAAASPDDDTKAKAAMAAALQEAAAALPRPPASPRRKQRTSRTSVRRSGGVEDGGGGGGSGSGQDVDLLTGVAAAAARESAAGSGRDVVLQRPAPVSASRVAMRNFSVPDPAELEKWKAEMRASFVRNEHYDDSPPISPRTYHDNPPAAVAAATSASSAAAAEGAANATRNGKSSGRRRSKNHSSGHKKSRKHTRKISAPANSTLTELKEDDAVGAKSTTTSSSASRHEGSKSASASATNSGGGGHVWHADFTPSVPLPAAAAAGGASVRSDSVANPVRTHRTYFDSGGRSGSGDSGGRKLRHDNIHMARARQRSSGGALAESAASNSNIIERIDDTPLTHSSYHKVALSAPKYSKSGAREKAHSVTSVGQRKVMIDALPFMKYGTRMHKKGRNQRRQVRWLFLSKDQSAIYWNGGLLGASRVWIRLKDIEAVIPNTDWSQHGCSFALKFRENNSYGRSMLHLLVFKQRHLKLWVGGLTRLVDCAKRGYNLGEITDVQVEIDPRSERPCSASSRPLQSDVQDGGNNATDPSKAPTDSNAEVTVLKAPSNTKPAAKAVSKPTAKPVTNTKPAAKPVTKPVVKPVSNMEPKPKPLRKPTPRTRTNTKPAAAEASSVSISKKNVEIHCKKPSRYSSTRKQSADGGGCHTKLL